MKTALLTGANGYIAQHIALMLDRLNYKVISSARDNHHDLALDFSSPATVINTKVDGSIDVMIHTVSPNESMCKENPSRAVSEHTAGIIAAMEFCVNNQIQDFVYFSSFHVFGHPSGYIDECSRVEPCGNYGLAHSVAEHTVQMYNRLQKVNAWILRPSNVFGVPVDLTKFKRWYLTPFAFCKEAMEKGSITLFTSGNQLRNFVGVTDVCRKLQWILEQEPNERIIHCNGKQSLSVLELAKLVQKIAKQSLGLSINISHPEGNEPIKHFKYKSAFSNPEINPTEDIEDFIEAMLKALCKK